MRFAKDVILGTNNVVYPPLFNGGGCCKTVAEVIKFSQSLVGAVLLGSITKEPRDGNAGNTWWPGQNFALNSLGMPNHGSVYLKQNIREMVKIVHGAGKLFVVNVAGFTPDEYAELVSIALEGDADAVEINLGCPNIIQKDGSRKPIPSYNLEVFEGILSRLGDEIGPLAPVWLKVSPNPITEMIHALAEIIRKFSFVKAITVMNTFPNSLYFDNKGESVIGVGLAGLSGPALKPIGLGQVLQWRRALVSGISVIAAGGISSGLDIRDYAHVGAQAFQVTTALLKGGNLNLGAFDRITIEYNEI